MPLTYYMDVHVPAAITEGLRRRQIDVLTSQQDGSRTWTDEQLLARSVALGRVLVSQDEDLLRLGRVWQAKPQPFPGIVFAPQQASSIGILIEDLILVAHCMSDSEMAGQVVYLPLS